VVVNPSSRFGRVELVPMAASLTFARRVASFTR